MINKLFSSPEEAVADIFDGSVIMFGGFGITGIPFTLIEALYKKGTRDITAISNSAGGRQMDLDLSILFKNRQIKKTYHTIVKGHLSPEEGTIDAPIGRSLHNRKKLTVREDGKLAVTKYRVLEYLNEHTYAEVNLITGRTHQIRVHFTYLGHPIAGDPVYSRGARKYKLPGIALCAKKLEFNHPVTDKVLSFEVELPEILRDLIERLSI